MEEIGLFDGADVDFRTDPLGTFLSHPFLSQTVLKTQPVIFYLESFLVGLVGVQGLDKPRFPEKKAEPLDGLEGIF